MNPDQEKNLLSTAQTIAHHLTWAWNYSATLRGFQQYGQECPAILCRNEHFVTTIIYALWDVLFLKLSHCSDNGRQATGFPKLFKQLQAYLPKQHELVTQMEAQRRRLKSLEVQSKVESWRHQVVAHYTITSDYKAFHTKHVVSLGDIEQLIVEMEEILHKFTRPLWDLTVDVRRPGHQARAGVARVVAGMKKEAET